MIIFLIGYSQYCCYVSKEKISHLVMVKSGYEFTTCTDYVDIAEHNYMASRIVHLLLYLSSGCIETSIRGSKAVMIQHKHGYSTSCGYR